MLKLNISASVTFSPNAENFIVAQHGQLNEDFQMSSSVDLYSFSQETKKLTQIQIPASLQHAAWSDEDSIALAADSQLFFCDQNLENLTQIDACDAEISAISYSHPHPQILLAVGSVKGEILFFEGEKLLYSTKNRSGENPHSGQISSISWNLRVPRVCVSADLNGNLIVWDQKKKGAIGSFQAGEGVVWAGFSVCVATCVCIVSKDKVVLWDMRLKGDCNFVYQIQGGQKVVKVEFLEGYDDYLCLRFENGSQQVLKVVNGEKIEFLGTLETGATEISLFYPNVCALVSKNEIIIKFMCQHANEIKPVIYNPLILTGLGDDDPEIIEYEQFNVTMDGDNQIVYLRGADNLQPNKFIKDMQEIVDLVQDCLSGDVELNELSKTFINHLKLTKNQLLDEYKLPIPKTEKIDLKQVQNLGSSTTQKTSDLDFFDQEEEQEPISSTPLTTAEQHQFSQQVLDFIYNGDIESAINYLANNNEISAAFYLALQFKIDTTLLCHLFKNQNQQWSSVFDIVDMVKQPQNLDIDTFSIENWKSAIVLIDQYDQQKLKQFLLKVLELDNTLSVQEKIDLNILVDQKDSAYQLVRENSELTFTQKLQLDVISNDNQIQVDKNNYIKIIDLLNKQNEQSLASELQMKLNIHIQPQYKQQSAQKTIPTRQPQYQQQQPTQQQPTQNNNNQLINSVQHLPPPPPPSLPIPSYQPNQTQPLNVPFIPPPPQFSQTQNNVLYATDLLQTQPQQKQQQQLQPPSFTTTFSSQLPPQQSEMFNPQSQNTQPMPYTTSKAPQLIAPPPPSINSSTPASNQLFSVPTTTAPKYDKKLSAIQSIDLALPPLDTLNLINTNSSPLAEKIIKIAMIFNQREPISFNKHWTKIADCAIWVSDNEVTPLLGDITLNVLQQYFDLIEQNKGTEAQKVIQGMLRDHSQEYEDSVSKWAGAFRFMGNAFK